MPQPRMNMLHLYLPLLANNQLAVRQQACLILLGTYGDRALTYLRRMTNDTDQQVCQEARLALLALTETTNQAVTFQPCRGMYIECMGRLRVYIGNHGMQPQDWAQSHGGRAGAQKVQAMLAYLVHCGRRGATRQALGAAAWGGPFSETSFARTLTALQQALNMYAGGSQIIEQALVVEGDYCLLDTECYHTDVQFFERTYGLATKIEREQGLMQATPVYWQAIQLYGGSYMADITSARMWCRQRRDHLMNSFIIAADRVAEQAYADQQYHKCIGICRVALDADPTADEPVIWLMRAAAIAGQRAELEHAYCNYLRATGLDKQNVGRSQDMVAQVYKELSRHRK
jgi:DNA-binding SARP family transcriptional activator